MLLSDHQILVLCLCPVQTLIRHMSVKLFTSGITFNTISWHTLLMKLIIPHGCWNWTFLSLDTSAVRHTHSVQYKIKSYSQSLRQRVSLEPEQRTRCYFDYKML